MEETSVCDNCYFDKNKKRNGHFVWAINNLTEKIRDNYQQSNSITSTKFIQAHKQWVLKLAMKPGTNNQHYLKLLLHFVNTQLKKFISMEVQYSYVDNNK